MMTATEASRNLGISRNTFYLRVKDLEIELVKEGRNSMIQPADVERIKEAIGTKRKNVSSVIGRHDRTSRTGQVGHLDDSAQALIDELRTEPKGKQFRLKRSLTEEMAPLGGATQGAVTNNIKEGTTDEPPTKDGDTRVAQATKDDAVTTQHHPDPTYSNLWAHAVTLARK